MPIGPMVPLTTAANPLAARILAAHLGAEGIVWELRGNVDGPYPVGPVEVLVPADDLEVARALVKSEDDPPTIIDEDLGPDPFDDGPEPEATGPEGRVRTVVLVVGLVLVVLFVLGRVLVLGG